MPNQTKFELSLFEEMLLTDVQLPSNGIVDLKPIIDYEALRIIRELRDATCRNCGEEHLERYIQTHQRAAIKLLDQLQNYESETSLYLTGALESILNYIEKEQSKYFDLNMAVTESYRKASSEYLMKNTLLLTGKLRSKEKIDPVLQKLILDYISEHCGQQTCTYQQLIYTKLLMANLLSLLSVNKDIDWNKKIILELFYLNFNKSSFFTYCRRLIANAVDDEPTFGKQVNKFNWYLKEIKQVQVKPNISCVKGRPVLTDLLLSYIGLELAHLAEVQSQTRPQQSVHGLKERAEKFNFKLPLSLTVKQLAFILQLFIETGVFAIGEGQILTAMKFFAAHVSTKGSPDVSADSLYNQRKKPLPKVRDEVEEILEGMLGKLRLVV